MTLPSPKFLGKPWKQKAKDSFLSPAIEETGKVFEQVILFPGHQDRNYTISFKMTLIDGRTTDDFQYKEAGVITRYNDKNRFYYSGVGGFGARTFIGKAEDNNGDRSWHCLAREGSLDEVSLSNTFDLRMDCVGSTQQLTENDILLLSANDSDYEKGYFGIRTVGTQVLLEKIQIGLGRKPRCFVAIPYATCFDFIYSTIEEEAEAKGFECVRADRLRSTGIIVLDMTKKIVAADVVIADLTGMNPNVYYEVGYAHAHGKNVVLIAQSPDDVTVDVSPYHYKIYESEDDLRTLISRAL